VQPELVLLLYRSVEVLNLILKIFLTGEDIHPQLELGHLFQEALIAMQEQLGPLVAMYT